MISLRDALRIMATSDEAGNFIPFSGRVVKLNLKQGTGGQYLDFKNAVLAGAPFGKKTSLKNANHFLNGTRNIIIPGNARPITIHNLLLIRFNEERVMI